MTSAHLSTKAHHFAAQNTGGCSGDVDGASGSPSNCQNQHQQYKPTAKQKIKILGYYLKFFILLLMVQWFCTAVNATGIGCFVCSSINGSNPECEDTFNSSVQRGSKGNVANYQFPCWAFKKNRHGLFPADHCIKVNGYRSDDPTKTIVIRTCALDSGTLTADTEIVRISHCGHFKYEGHQFTGCVQACDTDGCNLSMPTKTFNFWLLIFVIGLGFSLTDVLR